MKFTNTCPILIAKPITTNSYLVKVPASTNDEVNKYYYIGNLTTLNRLEDCPFTHRRGNYFCVQLLHLTKEQLASLLEVGKEDTLIEDNASLHHLAKKFKWQLKSFKKISSNQNAFFREQRIIGDRIHRTVYSTSAVIATLLILSRIVNGEDNGFFISSAAFVGASGLYNLFRDMSAVVEIRRQQLR